MKNLPYGETVNYWQTSQSSADSWIDKSKKEISQAGGVVTGEAYGSEPVTGRSAFMLAFSAAGQQYKIVWPVLPSKTANVKAAKIQAATLMYHDIKAKCMIAKIFGIEKPFFEYLMLDDGRVVSDLGRTEMSNLLPELFKTNIKVLQSGEIVEGNYRLEES